MTLDGQKNYVHAADSIFEKENNTAFVPIVDKGVSLEKIQKKTGADSTFVEDVARMYLTHQNVGVQGILDRIENKGK